MRRFLLFALVVVVLAAASWYYFSKATTLHIAALLPGDTIFFAHVPDFNRTRDQWHHSDIYELYREPAVQDFLRKPMAQTPKTNAASRTIADIERLGLKDAFVAVTSIENNNPILLAGFRFRGNQAAAEEVIGHWRANLLPRTAVTKPEKIVYRHYEIEVVSTAHLQIATVYVRHWFFASNDIAELQALLDRVIKPGRDRQSTLELDEAYRGAISHMPRDYALLVYLQPKSFAQKLATLRAAVGQTISADQPRVLEQIRSVCGTTRFDGRKMHDVFFAAMPRQADAKLMRSSEALRTADTFFYLATLLNTRNFDALGQVASMAPLGGWLRKFTEVAARSGLTAEDWKAAFQLELGALADWSANARWPSIIATLPVKDPARANKIATAVTAAADEDATWTKTEKDGAVYFSMSGPANVFAIAPTIGLSDRIFVLGLDDVSVEAAIKRSQNPVAPLANSPTYKSAVQALPPPTESFAYIDFALLYSRLDAALRPLLVMTAAFMPAISDHVDLGKLPPAEAVAKHLSPIVSSQRYEGDGYIAESIGPVTTNEAALVIGLIAIYWAATQQHPD
jgi:hypothetical protein